MPTLDSQGHIREDVLDSSASWMKAARARGLNVMEED